MTALRSFMADLLERCGAALEDTGDGTLTVMPPAALRKTWQWPDLVTLAFDGAAVPGAIGVGLEDDWIDRLGALLGEEGRLAARLLPAPEGQPPPDAERALTRGLALGNAVWRLDSVTPGWTALLLLVFRSTAISDERRESLLSLGFNCATGAVLDDGTLAALDLALAQAQPWQGPQADHLAAAGPVWSGAEIAARARPLLERRVAADLAPFLAAMRRRLARDAERVHAYHDDLRRAALLKQAGLARAAEAAAADTRTAAALAREGQRITAIEREYAAKLDDLRRNYALAVDVGWVQGLVVVTPVQRLALRVRRRKGERLLAIDWLSALRRLEPPRDEHDGDAGIARLACDAALHLTAPAGQAPCAACGRAFCRVCHPAGCPRCAAPASGDGTAASDDA